MADVLAVTLQASGAQTASGSGSAQDIGALRSAARLTLDVTATSGTEPRLSVAIETSSNSSTGWRQVARFDQAQTPTSIKLSMFGLDRYIRAVWTISGTTPSFTFSVSGEAHVIYATPDDVTNLAINSAATDGITDSVKAEACLSASADADSRLPPRYTLPLAAWGQDIRERVAQIAAYTMMRHRGFMPEGVDELIVKDKDDAQRWLSKAGAGTITPSGIVDSTPNKRGGAPRVFSRPARGWDDTSTTDD